jgi:hypothetical protein
MGFITRHRPSRAAIAALVGLSLSAVAIPSAGVAGQTAPANSSQLVGTYDGHQMEMAVGLELRADGRFNYGLSYGALDESASGTWRVDGNVVVLTSDPVTPPKFVLIEQRPASDGKMHIVLDLPKGWTKQYFDADIGLADGRFVGGQLSDDSDAIPLAPGDRPVSLRLVLGVYELRSGAFPLDGTPASRVHVRFEQNDLGKVAFAETPLRIDKGKLLLDRYGRSIVFRRVSTSTEAN